MTTAAKVGCGIAVGIAGTFLIVLLFFGYACGSAVNEVAKEMEAEQAAVAELVPENVDGVRESYGALKITGTIRNTTGRDFGYVSVTYDLVDAEGNVVGTAMDNHTGFRAGQTWKFEALALDDAESYVLQEVEAW